MNIIARIKWSDLVRGQGGLIMEGGLTSRGHSPDSRSDVGGECEGPLGPVFSSRSSPLV